ncbi:hypothetical protein [Gordonia sp. 'Campus']|uniref:hypothetical protein n=1 Tax=Gordonia sp. 'Campus' TaxID=2915824 RepID=UPI001EE3AA7E|nr:hypothetical protein [Gordonia sp. 'Campus']
MDDIDRRPIAMDTAQVSAVAGFYRRSSLVLSAVADDLAAHDFGGWARTRPESSGGASIGAATTFDELATTYRKLSATLAQRLREQAGAAGELADTLRNSAILMSDGDDHVAGEITRALPAARTDFG